MSVTVFFDLDGVLADFVGGALKFHGRTDIDPSAVQWGIEAQLGMAPALFWGGLGYDFWAGLEPYPDGLALLAKAAELVGGANVGLLTSPCDTKGCVDGKRDWVARHLPAWRRSLFVGSAKELFAGRGKVLVDDHDANVRKFSAAGGRTVQPPRPWNQLSHACGPGGSFDVGRTFGMLAREVRFAS